MTPFSLWTDQGVSIKLSVSHNPSPQSKVLNTTIKRTYMSWHCTHFCNLFVFQMWRDAAASENEFATWTTAIQNDDPFPVLHILEKGLNLLTESLGKARKINNLINQTIQTMEQSEEKAVVDEAQKFVDDFEAISLEREPLLMIQTLNVLTKKEVTPTSDEARNALREARVALSREVFKVKYALQAFHYLSDYINHPEDPTTLERLHKSEKAFVYLLDSRELEAAKEGLMNFWNIYWKELQEKLTKK